MIVEINKYKLTKCVKLIVFTLLLSRFLIITHVSGAILMLIQIKLNKFKN